MENNKNSNYADKFLVIYDYMRSHEKNSVESYPYIASIVDNMDILTETISNNARLLKTKCIEIIYNPDKLTKERLGFVYLKEINEVALIRENGALQYTFELIIDSMYKRVLTLKENSSAPEIRYYYLNTIMKKYLPQEFECL
ncbi:hypothetical protein [Edwardsiella tarda]|uniref:hypothetical protein n=1 Tax=Edwardsiella tarda TaxID=636 RepID=UPI000558E97C|nr:hypothetical protein [Edwardsiella tarda]